MNIGVLVEGQGEVDSVPVLLRKILVDRQRFDVNVSRPMRVGGLHNIINGDAFVRQYNYVMNMPNTSGALILADCDDGCPVTSRTEVIGRIRRDCAQVGIPVGIILLNREFESLFLSQADHLAVACDFFKPAEPQALIRVSQEVRNAKGVVRDAIPAFSYKETRDQVRIAAKLDVNLLTRHRAGRRLGSALTQILDGVSDL